MGSEFANPETSIHQYSGTSLVHNLVNPNNIGAFLMDIWVFVNYKTTKCFIKTIICISLHSETSDKGHSEKEDKPPNRGQV